MLGAVTGDIAASGSEGRDAEKELRDRIRGSLAAGAAGDALGYPVEFLSLESIVSKYGEKGITSFDTDVCSGKALVSDDTQMTLFTANGLLTGLTRGCMRGVAERPEYHVGNAYVDWLRTQTGGNPGKDGSPSTWLRDLPRMRAPRAPGTTCISACESLLRGREVNNDSRGCGGIMRVAPMGLLAAGDMVRKKLGYSLNSLAGAGALIARTTHHHPLGWLPAALQTALVYKLATTPRREAVENMGDIVLDSLGVIQGIPDWDFVRRARERMKPGEYKKYEERIERCAGNLERLTQAAVRHALYKDGDREAIRDLGEGWTAEEAWAISVYCAVRHAESLSQAVTAAVNHDGDSDSTGSITGNIMGAVYGYEEIKRENIFCPEGRSLEDTLELSDIILTLADDLSSGCVISGDGELDTPEKRRWYLRYCQMKPEGIPN